MNSPTVVEPTEILPADTTATPPETPVAAPAVTQLDQRQQHQHLHVHLHVPTGSTGDAEPADQGEPAAATTSRRAAPVVASRQTQLATVGVFVLGTLLSLLLAAPLIHSPLVAGPLVAAVLSAALAVRVATAPRNPIG